MDGLSSWVAAGFWVAVTVVVIVLIALRIRSYRRQDRWHKRPDPPKYPGMGSDEQVAEAERLMQAEFGLPRSVNAGRRRRQR